jgi:hypothetical protein
LAEEPKPYQVIFDYTDVPTIKRFALSNKRVRCLMGPFSSGKSSGCVIEIVRLAHAQKPAQDGIRRTRFVVVRNCYDDQTEVLTESRGWQFFKDVLPTDLIATLDGDNLVYRPHDGVVCFPYSGEMIGFEGEAVDFLVTPDHKMMVSKRRTRKKIWGEYEVDTAANIYGSELVRVRKDAQWTGNPTHHSLDFFEFLGFWFAEGSAGAYERPGTIPSKRLNLTQKRNTEYVELLLARNNFTYRKSEKKGSEGSDGCYAYNLESNKPLMDMFDLFLSAGLQPVRHVPQWIKDCDTPHLEAFLHGFFMGDGGNPQGVTRLYTSSKILADDLQEIVLKTGRVANIGMSDSTGREVCINGKKGVVNAPSYRVTILSPDRHRPVLKMNPKNTNHLKGWYKQQYDGLVYCVQMPLVPIYVRRSGNGFWCYRSYRQLCDTTIKTFMHWFPPKIFGEYRVTDHTYFMTKFPGVHLEIMFRALDRPDQVSNLLSLEVTGAWFNEVREIPREIIEAMDARIGRYPSKRDGGPTWHGIIMDTNPPDDSSYLYKMFEVVRPDTWEMFKQPSGLSPHSENTKNIPVKNYYQNLAKGKDQMYIRIYIHGQYGYLLKGKPVYTGFQDNIHVASQPLEPIYGIPLLIGFDFGLTPCCCIGQITPYGQLRILDELVSDGVGIKQFCQNQLLPLLRQKYFGMRVGGFGDPSGSNRSQTDESTCYEIMHSADVGLTDVEPAYTNAITARVNAVEHYLNSMTHGEPCFVLSPICKHIRRAMNGGYHYEKDPKSQSNEDFKLMPVKNYDSHIAESLQYLCLYIENSQQKETKHRQVLAQISLQQKTYRPASGIGGY